MVPAKNSLSMSVEEPGGPQSGGRCGAGVVSPPWQTAPLEEAGLQRFFESALNSARVGLVQAFNHLAMAVTLAVGKGSCRQTALERKAYFERLRHFLRGRGAGGGFHTLLGWNPQKPNGRP